MEELLIDVIRELNKLNEDISFGGITRNEVESHIDMIVAEVEHIINRLTEEG